MSISRLLSSAQNRSDQEPNIELAKSIANSENHCAINELVSLLSNKQTATRSDAIKVLYELGGMKPELIKNHHATFRNLLSNKDNRMIWGAMTAIQTYAHMIPGEIFNDIPQLIEIADRGTVITRDNMMRILISVAGSHSNGNDAVELVLGQLLSCPVNQLPMYAEWTHNLKLNGPQLLKLQEILTNRLCDIDQESKRKRLMKVLKKITV